MSETLQQLQAQLADQLLSFGEAAGDEVVVIHPAALLTTIDFLRQSGFEFLTDLAGVDYLTYPSAQPERFAVIYQLHDLERRRRIRLKVYLPASAPQLPTLADRWKGANWLERECWDQFGIQFTGHPDLKRILNHHEFVGHPLRKDYPIEARQPLTENDSLADEMARRLQILGLLLPDSERELLRQPINYSKPSSEEAERQFYSDLHTGLMFLNLGPSHPAAHGTLRTFVALDGETIVAAVGEIGYLHRGFEKSTETQCYNDCIPYT
ncbi:MAG: NADH-quinone oxidoreductase subunit C, partial [Cyanobacteria bacterium NC_groundwater_1444_Ag_S-0.65um_54_12]|nr:NADH-quinone oxidoreductase subunit C [Cyanobacteria bacterium NC_groundwater_1444_Ag_S-0.65um_54_12]